MVNVNCDFSIYSSLSLKFKLMKIDQGISVNDVSLHSILHGHYIAACVMELLAY